MNLLNQFWIIKKLGTNIQNNSIIKTLSNITISNIQNEVNGKIIIQYFI